MHFPREAEITGVGWGGQAAKGSRVDWYAQAAFPRGGGGSSVSYTGMSSKGTLGAG